MKTAIFFVLFVVKVAPAHAEVRVTDDAGHTLSLPRPAKRVISLAPSVTEMIYEAGAGDRLIGTVEYSDHPPAARQLPRVGSNQSLDLERIASLKPDLILIWFHGNAAREVEQLAALGFPMFHVEPRRIEDVAGAIERIGELLDSRNVARDAASRFRARYTALRKRFGKRSTLDVFYQIADVPLLTINDRQIISDVIRLCGGRNVFGKEPALVPLVSTESVLAVDPDVILAANISEKEADGVRPLRAPGDAVFSMWRRFSNLKANRTRQMWLIPANPISRQGPRILDGVEAVCTALDEARKAQ
jgi:iron complex transport system substrate-binding protein